MNIPIFLSSDDNYAPFVATTIASVCDNTKSFIDFYVLDSGISEQNKKKIKELKQSFSNFSIEFIVADINKYFASLEYKNHNKYITKSTYNRFIIPYIKPQIDKAIYLDVDIIVNLDISELYNIELGDFEVGAVSDSWCNNKLQEIGYQNSIFQYGHCYFNAGVLLINNKKWLERDIRKTVIEIEQMYHKSLQYADQDILNLLYNCSNYKIIDKKYNMLNFMDEISSDKYILHYAGDIKPWQVNPQLKSDVRIPMLRNKQLFWKYAYKTAFYEQLVSNLKYKNNIDMRKYLVYELLKQRAEQERKNDIREVV